MARKRGTFRIFYNGLDPSGTGNPGTAWVTGRGFGSFQRPVNTQQQLLAYIMSLKPLAYWPLNDPAGSLVAKDITGNGFNGTVTGSVTFGSAGLTSFGETSALLTGGYITAPIAVNMTDSTTIAIIKNTNAVGTGGYQQMVGIETCSLSRAPGFWYFENGSEGSYGPANTADINTHTMVALASRSSSALYKDGTLYASGLWKTLANSTAATIGQVDGTIAHVAILPYAMTPDQITALQDFITAGPVANFGGLADAAVGPMGALSVGGPARGSKGYGVVAAASASNNGPYDTLSGNSMPAGSAEFLQYLPGQAIAFNQVPQLTPNLTPISPYPPRGQITPNNEPSIAVGFVMVY